MFPDTSLHNADMYDEAIQTPAAPRASRVGPVSFGMAVLALEQPERFL
jgi:hypothetical protein